MKGITHFLSGIAVATFIPGTVHAAAQDASFVIALGGVFGLLPDYLDFKFARYLDPIDERIQPDPLAFDPQAIADQLARNLDKAFTQNRPRVVQLQTIPLGPDLWRQYTIVFALDTNEVVVRLGPVVNTSRKPYPQSIPENAILEGRAAVPIPMNYTYDAETRVDIFGGPSFEFVKTGGSVSIIFLPWHRRWSHSLVVALVFGLIVGGLLGATAGAVAGLGYAIHILEDQLGHMGSNLFWPLSQIRFPGMHWMRSDSDLPNFATVWIALAMTFFNLDRLSARPQLEQLPYLIYAVIVPAAIMILIYVREIRQKRAAQTDAALPHDPDATGQSTEGA